MKKLQLLSLALGGILVVLLAACGSGGSGGSGSGNSGEGGAEGETFVLKGATAWPENNIHSTGFFVLQKKVEEASEGRVTIEYTGGPESIPPFELGDAVRNGVVDVATISAAYYIPELPAASALDYSELSPEEERENGAMDYMNQLHNETLNAQILSRAGGAKGYSLYTKKPVDSMDDFQGLRMRVSPVYTPFVKALGAEAIEMPGGEIYQGLERGVIDGFTWPEFGITDFALEEQVVCKVLPAYWQIDTVSLMNLDKWNELPADLQEIVKQAAIEANEEVAAEVDKYMSKEDQELLDAGVSICEMQEAQKFTQTADDAGWKWVAENVPSEQAGKLEELFRK